MTRRIIDTSQMPRRTKADRTLATKIDELTRFGGGMKHRLMTLRLERRDAKPRPVPALEDAGWALRRATEEYNESIEHAKNTETRLCPTCSMHVSAEEAAYCMLCEQMPLIDATPEGTTHITLALPYWWRDAEREEG